MKYFLYVLIVTLIGCAATKETIEKEKPAEKTDYPYNESFDPMSLKDDDINIKVENMQYTDSISTQNSNNALPDTFQATPREINGFRVQILATKDIEQASLIEETASSQFMQYEHKTYLIFETPLYKIRVGDCRNRKEAEQLRELAQSMGYRESFIVRTKVMVTDADEPY